MTEETKTGGEPTPAEESDADNPIIGIGLKIASTIVFAVMLGLVKTCIEQGVPVGEVLFARSFFGIPPLLIWLHYRPGGIRGALRTRDISGHFIRALIGLAGMAFWFSAIARLPLPDAQAIVFAGPFFGVVLAVLILRERVRVYRWSAVLVGFLGVLVVLSTHLGSFDAMVSDTGFIGALFALGSATTGALAMIQVRRLTHSEGTGAIVFYFSAFSALLALLTLFFGWVMPTTEQTLYLILAGLLGGVGQVLMTHSYRFAEASIIAPFDYTAMLWVILLGIFVFGEIPGPNVIIGSVIIVGSGVFVLIREHRNGLLRSKARRANTPT